MKKSQKISKNTEKKALIVRSGVRAGYDPAGDRRR